MKTLGSAGYCEKHGEGATTWYACTTQEAANALYYRLTDQCENIVPPGGDAGTSIENLEDYGYVEVWCYCSDAHGCYKNAPS